MSASQTPEQWGAAYQRVREDHRRFGEQCKSILDHLLDDAGIGFSQMELRTKSVESFVAKLKRKDSKYTDPLREVTDLSGIRIVTRGPRDLDRIGELIENNFCVIPEHSQRRTGPAEPDRFGYRSDHYVVSFDERRLALPEYRRYHDGVAEIQVRTVMEHAWAVYDHQLRYKNPDQLPVDLRRQLFRLSALLEIADDQFGRLADAADALEATYSKDVERGDLSASLDVLSVEAFLGAGTGRSLAERAVAAGWAAADETESFPRSLGRLVSALRAIGIEDLEGVEQFVQDADPWIDDLLRRICKLSSAGGFVPFAVPPDILTFAAYRKHGDPWAAFDEKPNPALAQAIEDAIAQMRT